MTSNRDLRKYMDSEVVASAFGKIVSGRAGYKAVTEKRKDPTICPQCRINLAGDEKFCPECGARTGFK